MNIVIIGHNEEKSIRPMKEHLAEQGLLRSAVWVLDRCTDNSEEVCRELDLDYILNSNGDGRQTSYCRNLGYKWMSDRLFQDGTLFLDADRWPVVGDLNELEKAETDIVMLKLERDPRNIGPADFNAYYGTVYNNFFSCGIYIKQSACDKITAFYKERPEYGNSIIFPENCQRYWGIEDTHLGDICYHLGLSCQYSGDIVLQGEFNKFTVDSLDTIEERFKLRDKLNVIW